MIMKMAPKRDNTNAAVGFSGISHTLKSHVDSSY
jgi:hypothetical protein